MKNAGTQRHGGTLVFLLVLFVSMPLKAATEDPYACPTNAQAQSDYSVTATPINSATIRQLMTNADAALGAGGPVAGVLPASAALSPSSVAQGLLDMAKEELGAYFASVALEKICGSTRAAPYFPNTCQLNGSGDLEIATDTQLNSLTTSMRADVRGLPSCLVKRRTGSPLGYLTYSAYQALSVDRSAEFSEYLHGMALHAALASACENSATTTEATAPTHAASGNGLTQPITNACKLYYVIVAIDAINVVHSTWSTAPGGDTWDATVAKCKKDFTTCTTLLKAFEQAFVADLFLRQSKPTPTDSNLTADPFVARWITYLRRYYLGVTWPVTARLAVAVGTIAEFVNSTEGEVAALKSLRAQLSTPAPASGDTAGAAAQESNRLSVAQKTATVGKDLVNLLAAGGGILQLFDAVESDAKLRSSANSKAPMTDCQVVAGKALTPPQKVTTAYCLSDRSAELIRIISLAATGYSDYQAENYAAVIEDGIEIVRCASKPPACTSDADNAELPSNNVLRFVATVAAAKDAKSFSDVLKSVGAPLNAWKEKSNASMWWIGSMVGAQFGTERNTGQGMTFTGHEYGGFAPIGTGISWPDPWRKHPIGLFASVVDVGALITVSHGNASVNSAAQSGWSQTLSPGLFAFYEPFGPICFGLGYVYKTPALRTTTGTNGTLVDLDSSRFMLFVAVDVTVLRLR